MSGVLQFLCHYTDAVALFGQPGISG